MSLPLRPSFELNTVSMTALNPRRLEEWNGLAAACRQPLAAASLLEPWLAATNRLDDSVLIEVRHEGDLVAALPLTQQREAKWGWPRRVVSLATTLDLPSLDPLLLAPARGARDPNAGVLLDALAHAAIVYAGKDALHCAGVGPEAPLAQSLRREGLRRGLSHQRQPSRSSAQVDVSAGFETLASRCSLARQRATMVWRDAYRRGAFEVAEIREIDEARAAVIEVFQVAKRSPAALHRQSLACSPSSRQFVRTAMLTCAAQGSLALQVLRIDGRAQAFAWFVVSGGQAWRLASAACDSPAEFDLSGPLAAEGLRRLAARGVRRVHWCDELSGADTGWVFERPAAISLRIAPASPLTWLSAGLSRGEG